nr:hypothetical protein [Candidatus Mycoplasma haematolamae]
MILFHPGVIANGGILDLSAVPEDIKSGKFDWNNQTKKKQHEYFTF